MRNYLPVIGVTSGSLLLLSGLHTASLADTLTVHVQNVSPYRVELQFHSETSGGVWPGNGQVWVQSDGQTYDYRLSCMPGEKICMGASAHVPAGMYFWGVDSPSRTCVACCWTCGDDTQLQRLSVAAEPLYTPPPAASYTDPDPVGTARIVQNGMISQYNSTLDLMHAMQH